MTNNTRRFTYVYFDLETTGLDTLYAEIVSIGAVPRGEGDPFQNFIIPQRNIDPGASEVNGFTKHNNRLYLNGQIVESAVYPETGLTQFISYLTYVKEKNYNFPLVLVAHNCFAFDMKVLLKSLIGYFIKFDSDLIGGFSDSLLLAQDHFRFRKPIQGRYKLTNLMLLLLNRDQNETHDSLDDAIAVGDCIEVMAWQRRLTSDRFMQRLPMRDFMEADVQAWKEMTSFRIGHDPYKADAY